MKKIKRLLAALLLAALTLNLTACGSKLEGKWTLDVEAMKEAYGSSDLISAADMGVDSFAGAGDMKIAENGDLYIADSAHNRVLIFGQDWRLKMWPYIISAK